MVRMPGIAHRMVAVKNLGQLNSCAMTPMAPPGVHQAIGAVDDSKAYCVAVYSTEQSRD